MQVLRNMINVFAWKQYNTNLLTDILYTILLFASMHYMLCIMIRSVYCITHSHASHVCTKVAKSV